MRNALVFHAQPFLALNWPLRPNLNLIFEVVRELMVSVDRL